MIARHHANADPGILARGYRARHFRSHRVGQADEAEQREVCRMGGIGRRCPARDSENAIARRRQSHSLGRQNRRDINTHGQDGLDRSLDVKRG